MWDFMREHVFPAEPVWRRTAREHGDHDAPAGDGGAQGRGAQRGLWNLFLPELSGLSNLEYAAVAEISGWSPVIAPEAINCQAPDTGNMETLHLFGTAEQKQRVARAAAGGRDPLGVRDDRARRRLLRRHQHPDLDRPRRRRLRHQRPQVVDHRRRRRALPDLHRDGQDRPRRPSRTGSSRWSWSPATPPAWRSCGTCRSSATRTSTGTPRSRSTTSGCRRPTCSPARATAS